jgi:DNA-binding NarL/FixJ family response regulator
MDNLKVAIVDDESGIRESYKRFIKREYKKRYENNNIDIVVFEDGSSAVEYINSPSSDVDIVVLDYHLPDMLGDEVLLRLREKNKNIPVVMVTSHDSSETTRATFKAGGVELTEYIPKPPDFRLLIYTMELLCEKYKSMVFQNQLMEIERNYKLLKEISENWKQPMNIVSMILYRMVEEESEEERNKLFDDAYNHIKKASSLLDIFKDYTLLTKKMGEFDLVTIVKNTLYDYKSKLSALDIEIDFNSSIESFKINGYEKLMSRALFYLIANCIDALEACDKEHKKISIKIEDIGIGCNLIIKDNSAKLDSEKLDAIFDPRYESDKSSRGGMELYLSYLCVTANSAAIKSSNHEDGVAFTIHFK